MHHGYYPNSSFHDHRAAQTMMIEQSLKWAFGFPPDQPLPTGFFQGKHMVDVGCGVGGSSRYIIRNYGGSAVGVSLSPFQVKQAKEYSARAHLSDVLDYQVADAMHMPFPDNSFDLSKGISV